MMNSIESDLTSQETRLERVAIPRSDPVGIVRVFAEYHQIRGCLYIGKIDFRSALEGGSRRNPFQILRIEVLAFIADRRRHSLSFPMPDNWTIAPTPG